jgi:hypothetical protein
MSKPTITLIESLISNSHRYVETRLDLFKLKMIDKSSEVASSIASGIALFLVFFIFFIVVNIGLALLIGDLLGRAYLGFFILAALYAIIGLVLFKSRHKWIKGPIVKMFLHKFVKDTTSWDK